VNFYGVNPRKKTAEIWDDGTARFSATTRSSIGLAVASVLAKPEATANRTVYISSTELSVNDLLAAEQKVVGGNGWTLTRVDTDEQIREQQQALRTATERMPRLMATGRLGMAVQMKPEFGANFADRGILDNEALGIPRANLDDVVQQVLAGLKA
jgi:hypothetical protein